MGLGNRMSDSYFKQIICFKNLTRVRCLTHAQAAAILTGADLMDPVSALSEAVTQGLYHEWSVTKHKILQIVIKSGPWNLVVYLLILAKNGTFLSQRIGVGKKVQQTLILLFTSASKTEMVI